ncbi:MAG: type II secretion system F family protein [Phycisphaerales bacterium]|nr:type II secretion system F family protein [Phycisphaerales bacterium]
MQTFRYQGLGGAASGGVIQAVNRADAMRQLSQQGIVPTALETSAPLHGQSANASGEGMRRFAFMLRSRTTRPTISRTDLTNFIREIATALEAGLPLMQSLRTVRRQATGRALPVILDFLIERVEAGVPLHQAAKEYGPPFDDMTVGMFRAADASGRNAEVLHQLADLLDRSVELKREVVGATVYPMLVAGLVSVSVVVLVTFVLPRLMAPITGQPGMVLPFPTRVLLGVASFITVWWWAIILAVVGGVIGWRRWVEQPRNRMLLDLTLLRTPILGVLLRDVAVARFTRTLGTLVSAGIPILQALRVVRDTLGNAAMMAAIDDVQELVTTGSSLADPLERSGFFPPLLIQIVNIGERSGRLEPMLMHAANAFDRQVNQSLKVFTKALPPILLIVMGVVAGFVLLGILLPLLQLQSAIGG